MPSCKSFMQINTFLSTGSMKLPSGAVCVDPDNSDFFWQVAKDTGWHPGLPALCSCHLWLCPPPLGQRSSPLEPEGEEGVAALRPCWAVGWRGLHSVPLCQRTDPRAAWAHPGISAQEELVLGTAGKQDSFMDAVFFFLTAPKSILIQTFSSLYSLKTYN